MSITLAQQGTISFNGSVMETDSNAALEYIELQFPTTARLFFNFGNTSGQVFTSGSLLPRVIITLNLVNGAWSSSSGQNGVFSGAALSSLQTTLVGFQNMGETFATSQSIIQGTQVPWTVAEL